VGSEAFIPNATSAEYNATAARFEPLQKDAFAEVSQNTRLPRTCDVPYQKVPPGIVATVDVNVNEIR
jgi:hypothetical protein